MLIDDYQFGASILSYRSTKPPEFLNYSPFAKSSLEVIPVIVVIAMPISSVCVLLVLGKNRNAWAAPVWPGSIRGAIRATRAAAGRNRIVI
jgi:hypothetical protein